MDGAIMLGDLQLEVVSGGKLWIDGGNMFGVIPRVLWERKSPPDEQNRIALDTNCILVRFGKSLGLVDTGYGGKAPPRFRQRFSLEDGSPLVRNLAAKGIEPGQIDWVILTHLHFDHAGGCTFRDAAGQLQPTFPRAKHFVQRIEWEDATAELPVLAGAYFPEDFAVLQEAGLMELVNGSAEIRPGVKVELTDGHTRGHQLVKFDGGQQLAVLPADMCPTAAHLPTFWTMAYDQFPLTVRAVKPAILNDIVNGNRIVLFCHDPKVGAARLAKRSENEWDVAVI